MNGPIVVMCANYKPITAEQRLSLGLPDIPFEYPNEVYPSFQSPLLFKAKQGLEWRLVNFGLIPKWAIDKDAIKYSYNARNETLGEKPSFRAAFQKCNFGLIAVTEIYEAKYVNGRAQRWAIKRKDGQAFFIAALYEIAKIQDHIIRSASMITMDAVDHEIMKEFNEPGSVKRSVVIIPHQRLNQWLNLKSPDIQSFIEGFPVEEFECFYSPKLKKTSDSTQLNFFE